MKQQAGHPWAIAHRCTSLPASGNTHTPVGWGWGCQSLASRMPPACWGTTPQHDAPAAASESGMVGRHRRLLVATSGGCTTTALRKLDIVHDLPAYHIGQIWLYSAAGPPLACILMHPHASTAGLSPAGAGWCQSPTHSCAPCAPAHNRLADGQMQWLRCGPAIQGRWMDLSRRDWQLGVVCMHLDRPGHHLGPSSCCA